MKALKTTIATLALAASLTACSGSSDSTSASSSSEASSSASPTPQTKEEVAAELYAKYDPLVSAAQNVRPLPATCGFVVDEVAQCDAIIDGWVSMANDVADDLAAADTTITAVSDAIAEVKQGQQDWDARNCGFAPAYSVGDPTISLDCATAALTAYASLINISNTLKDAAGL